MSRIRTIKPDFFKHEGLFDAERETGLPLRLAFAGLWTQCDREGRFVWRPRQLKTDVLPYDDIDFSRVLDALMTRGFILKYASKGEVFGYIPSWSKHQVINNREKASDLPDPVDCKEETDALMTREPRVDDAILQLPSGRERKGKEGEMEKEGSEAKASGADAPFDPEKELFDRGKTVLGKDAGGLITRLLKSKQGKVALARAAIETASTKQDPREYIGAIVRGTGPPDDIGYQTVGI